MTRTRRRLHALGAATVLVTVLGTALGPAPGPAQPAGAHAPGARATAASDPAAAPHEPSGLHDHAARRLAALERDHDARLGVVAIDTGTGQRVDYRADERFAVASTMKVFVAGLVLERYTDDELERRVRWSEDDLVSHSPVTELYVGHGMTVRQLIDAALTMSDNTAVNLLLDLVGGPGAVDDRLADLGDHVTSLDRIEPELNDWRPGEVRDTSTPRALADSFRRYALGDVLEPRDRDLLDEDLADSATGYDLVRAGVPRGWEVGDKSGSATYGTRNDVAVVRPPGRAPWVVVVMSSHDDADAAGDGELLAEATKVVVDTLPGPA
ncbi:class A beta-lactamase [Isoptericola cucumis]|uniref:Beta-lactamase n=1 Tax=Isoptericola cucumis TaxID=1776856 RepID=A0ABQ2B626_9MICO|nr:class A beta-lactamase [Isoptericola cucumis]GGI06283.1 beta-lactamase [Isoptericola cucumis]